ncbi:MAG: hypothetical protein ACKOEQ_10450 [Verrucomicrobiota bacterium]
MSAKRPPSPKPVPGPVPIPAPAPPPVQRVPKPKYDETFGQDAVRCWLNSGKPAHVVAAELGIMVEGRRGKQADGSAKTRQVYLGCVFTQHRCDEEGHPVRGWDSTT